MNIDITLAELKERAKEMGLKGYSKMNKEELFKALILNESNNIKGEIIESKNDSKIESNIESINISDIESESNLSSDLKGFKLTSEKLFDSSDKVYLNDSNGKKIVIRKSGKKVVIEPEAEVVSGYLEVANDGYGFLRDESLKPTDNDVYVSANMVKRFNLLRGDYVIGIGRRDDDSKSKALLFVTDINNMPLDDATNMLRFDMLIPIYPNTKINLSKSNLVSNNIIDMFAPIGFGQRSLIVSPPKAGKTMIIKNIAKAINENNPDVELIVLLVDERPEEVTEMEEIVKGHVVASTFDQKPENHIHMAEFTVDIAKRKAEAGKDVVILLDSITRLARAYNLVVPSSGKILSGGFDPHALYKPKHFFGAARNTKEAGSVTIIATALVETGSKMDDLIYEEFKGTGNQELHLDRNLAERRVYPAINILKSGTRRDELLYTKSEKDLAYSLRSANSITNEIEYLRKIISTFENSNNFEDLKLKLKKIK